MTRKDAGIYTVKCENDEGVNQTTFTLDVLCKTLFIENAYIYPRYILHLFTYCNSMKVCMFVIVKASLYTVFL